MAIEAGVDPEPLRHALETCCTTIETDDEPRITPRTAILLSVAAQMAMAAGASQIEPIQLAMVLVGVPDAIAWRGLRAAGLTPDLVVAGIRRRSEPNKGSRPN